MAALSRLRSNALHDRDNILEGEDPIHKTGFHCGSHAKSLVDLAKL